MLVERNKANNYVYFPLAGLISVHTIFADHVSLDIVGKEGTVRVFVAADVKAPHARIAVRGSGSATRVAANALRFRNLIDHMRARRRIIDRRGLIKAACGCYGANAVEAENLGR